MSALVNEVEHLITKKAYQFHAPRLKIYGQDWMELMSLNSY